MSHIDLVSLLVEDYDEAIAFYVGQAGFELVEDSAAVSTADGSAKRWVVVRPPGAQTGLLLARAADPAQRAVVGNQTGGRVGLFLHTDDFAATHQRMRQAGVTFIGEPRDEPYGRVVVWQDLYGNRWDLIEPTVSYPDTDAPVDHGHATSGGHSQSDSTPDGADRAEDDQGGDGQRDGRQRDDDGFRLDHHVGDILISSEEIARRITELGQRITDDYAGRTPLLVAVLKGSLVFLSDLMRAIRLPVEVDVLAVSSYGAATKSSGVVRIIKDLDHDVAGRDVLLVEDIVDSGLTLRYLLDRLSSQGPASLRTCSLLVREGGQDTAVPVDYEGFRLPATAFVIGYGLDAGQRYRNLPFVASYTPD